MFLQAMRHEAYKCSAWKPFLRSYTMRNKCTCSPLEDAFEDAFARGFRGWFGLGQLQIPGNEIALRVVSCKVQLPIKDMGHSPHTPGSFIGIKEKIA